MQVSQALVVEEEVSALLLSFVLTLRKTMENLETWGAAEGWKMMFWDILWISNDRILSVENYITATFQFFWMQSKIN